MLGAVGRTPKIPAELKVRPFSLEEARAAGITLSALRGRSWRRVGHELYRWAGASEDTWHLLSAWQKLLPASSTFVGRTAAWVHGLDVQPANPVQVALPTGLKLRSRLGLDVWQSDVSADAETVRRLRVTTLERTLLDMCARSTAIDALIVLDMAIGTRLSRNEVRRYADLATGPPGSARMRSLAESAAPAESPMETRLRWLLLEARLPAPEVQSDIYDDSGELIARADLYYPSANLVIEFDGGNHRDRLISDDRRQNKLVAAGYRILRFTSADLRIRPRAIVLQVQAALSP
jgi:very-short-patch-repair endonuclease